MSLVGPQRQRRLLIGEFDRLAELPPDPETAICRERHVFRTVQLAAGQAASAENRLAPFGWPLFKPSRESSDIPPAP